jgi:hypothetical protein
MVSHAVHKENHDFVRNYMHYGDDHMGYVAPFDIVQQLSSSIDDKLSLPSPHIRFHMPPYSSIAKNTFVIDSSAFDELRKLISVHFQRIRNDLISSKSLYKTFNQSDEVSRLLVKVVHVSTYRDMLTALKQIHFQNRIYNARYITFRGSDIVAKPLLCCPVWNGCKWKFILVTEFVEGASLHKVRSVFNKLFHRYDRIAVISSLEKIVRTLWMLGFSHNDLSDYNVVYDRKTGTAKLIDFETCVQLPYDVVERFRDHVTTHPHCYEHLLASYEEHMKYPALALLSISEKVCLRYVGEDRLLYNTDDRFIDIARHLV